MCRGGGHSGVKARARVRFFKGLVMERAGMKIKSKASCGEAAGRSCAAVRDTVRADARGGREAARGARGVVRKAVRNVARGCAVALAVAFGVFVLGCATSDPTSKQAKSEANRNVTTINNYVGLIPMGTNCPGAFCGAPMACGAGGFSLVIHDLNGTIAQSANAGGDESVEQTAVPTLQAGLTGDKAIEETAGAIKSVVNPAGSAGTTGLGAAVAGVKSLLPAGSSTNAPAAKSAAVSEAVAPAAGSTAAGAVCAGPECQEALAEPGSGK